MKGKNKMRNTLILITIAFASIGNTLLADGWGQKQTQRTIGGALGGATIGGIIGHQHDKQKEGIIIGSVLGMIIGNKSGQGADYREEQRQWELQKREMAHRERLRREEQRRIEEAKRRQFEYRPISQNGMNRGSVVSDEVTQARPVQSNEKQNYYKNWKFVEFKKSVRRALLEFQEAERKAQEQLQRLRNGENVNTQTKMLNDVNYQQSPVHFY